MTYGSLILRIGWAAKGFNPFTAYKELREREKWSRAEIKELQSELLRKLIRHSYNNVPYYNELFKRHGLTPDDIRTVEDLPKIPVQTKNIIRREGKRMLATNFDKSVISEGYTGGSTGTPLTVYKQKSIAEWVIAGLWRNYARCGWEPGEVIGTLWGWRHRDWEMPKWKMGLREFFSRTCRIDPFNLSDEQLARAVERLRKTRPTILMGYASALRLLGQYLRRTGQKLTPLKGCYSSAEVLYPEVHKLLQDVFDCGVFDFYGSGEVLHIGCDCPEGKMHINSDSVILETGEAVDAEGHRAVIITGLRSYAMPFIRYVNGDAVAYKPAVCQCGLPFPTIELKVARRTDFFRFANGRVLHGEYFTHEIFGANGIKTFQFHQVSEDLIYLRFVPAENFSDEDQRIIEAACKLIEKDSDGTTRCEVLQVNDIKKTSASKHRFTISDLQI